MIIVFMKLKWKRERLSFKPSGEEMKMRTKILSDEHVIAALKSGIEYYSSSRVKRVSVVEDPLVTDTYAIRCYIGKIKFDFLIVGFKQSMTKKEIADNLEECEFESFPPESGSLKFFL
jgi:hypothetical protein